MQAGYRRHHGSGINLYADLIACHLIGCGKHFAWNLPLVQQAHGIDAVIGRGRGIVRVLARGETSVEQVHAVAQTIAGRPCRIHVAGEHATSGELLEGAVREHAACVTAFLLRFLRDGEALVRDLEVVDEPEHRSRLVVDRGGALLVVQLLAVDGVDLRSGLVGRIERVALVFEPLGVGRVRLRRGLVRGVQGVALVGQLLRVGLVDLRRRVVFRVEFGRGLLAVELVDVRGCGLGLLGCLVGRVDGAFDVLLAEVVHHLPRLLGAVRGLLVVGFELGFRNLLVEFVEVGLGILGFLLGLGVVHVELRLVAFGGLLDAVGTQTPPVRQSVSGLFAHARSFGLPYEGFARILQDAVGAFDLASGEVGVLTLLEYLLRSVLRAAGDILQGMPGLCALLAESVEQVAVLVEHSTIVFAGVRQLADLLVELVHGLVGGQVVGFQAEERFDKSVDFLGRVLGAASEVLVRAGGVLGGLRCVAVGVHGVLGGCGLLLGLFLGFAVCLGFVLDAVAHLLRDSHLRMALLAVFLQRGVDLVSRVLVAHGCAGHVGQADLCLAHPMRHVGSGEVHLLVGVGDGATDVTA